LKAIAAKPIQGQVMGFDLEARWSQLGEVTRAGVHVEHALAAAALEVVMVVVPRPLVTGDLRWQ
jgi:hypothetical protein